MRAENGLSTTCCRDSPPPGRYAADLPRVAGEVTDWRWAPALLAATTLLLMLGAPTASLAEDPATDADLEFFEREVRPLLVEHCFECHSVSADEPKGGLRLDARELILQGGDTGPAIVPGEPAESLLVDAINYGEIYQMPPKTRLPAREVAILTQWVQRGAPWPAESISRQVEDPEKFDLAARLAAHWCWAPPQRPALPTVRQRDWPRQDLDFFILEKLEAQGLAPARRADRQTLLRRLYFDLIGLPPSPVEVERFLGNDSPHAFAELVDRLLDSPQFGERWARHWLDLVRYAETYGHEFDYPVPHAWKYRDYVIRALNADLPYDRFVVEQIAGDLLRSPRRHPAEGYDESAIGTGFWWLGEATHSPVDVRGDEAGRIDNQIDVMSKTFLGLTVACARCHDHKFDAISTKDYYALAGFLQSSRRDEAILDPHAQLAAGAARINALRRQAAKQLSEQLAAALTPSRFASQLNAARIGGTPAVGTAEHAAGNGAEQEGGERWRRALQDEALLRVDHPLYAWRALLDREIGDAAGVRLLRDEIEQLAAEAAAANAALPLLVDFSAGGDSWGDWFASGHAFGPRPAGASELSATEPGWRFLRPGSAHSGRVAGSLQGVMRSPTFTLEHPYIFYQLSGEGAQVRLILDGYFMDVYNALLFKGFTFDVHTAGKKIWYRQGQDVSRYVGHRAHIEVIDHGDGFVAVDEIRFSPGPSPKTSPSEWVWRALGDTAEPGPLELAEAYGRCWQQAAAAIQANSAGLEQTQLVNWALRHGLLEDATEVPELHEVQAQLALATDSLTPSDRALAMTDGTPENERVFIRGNHRTLGDEVPRRLLAALGGVSGVGTGGSGRLELARQIADPANPLTARVLVNRLWHHLLGRGIVASVDNFGVLGQAPTHPELLDHLAVRFVEEGWSIKGTIRRIVLSSTYQMSSVPRPDATDVDPRNVLLHRMRVRRLEGEVIRDALLAVSGELDETLFGPSVPTHVTKFMQGRGRPKESGPLDGRGRRSIYLQVRRNFLSPMMLAFDTPIPFSTMGRRNSSNVPAQALMLMNDPFVVAQSEQWAERLLASGLSQQAAIQQMYLAAFARRPSSVEQAACLEFLDRQSNAVGGSSQADGYDQQAWKDLAHVLFNVKEFIFLN